MLALWSADREGNRCVWIRACAVVSRAHRDKARAMAAALARANGAATKGEYVGPHPSITGSGLIIDQNRGWRTDV